MYKPITDRSSHIGFQNNMKNNSTSQGPQEEHFCHVGWLHMQ